MKTLETPRLILRTWEESDAADLYDYAQSENVGPNAGWKPHESLEETKAVIRMFREDDNVWAVVLKEENRVIGSVGLHGKWEDARELGYVLSDKYWGRGIIPEASREALRFAFEEMGMQRVVIGHFPHNQRSKRVIEKLGFRHTGYAEKAFERYDGVMMDEERYEMTKEEWNKLFTKN